uniref:C-Jun-amino-terminal kinase-interacting protein 3 n=1 Tax=Maylandia zebra TaxID=106582 RepID=A0A3P9CJ07_9CICH
MRGREKERERRERDLEKKARQQADQVALEEQKANLSRELSALRNTHNKLALTYRELLEKRKFVIDIINSTPELAHFNGCVNATPVKPDTEEPLKGELETSFKDEMNELGQSKVEEEKGEEADKKDEGEEVEDEDSIEWELRNTDSVFSELSELSRDYVESVDRGASVRSVDQSEEILSQYEELKVTELVETARKTLISRVVELTDERSALKLEVETLRETLSRLEGRVKEKEEETKLRKELETCQSEDSDVSQPASMRNFSRSEMARVVMEKNQYKQRLFELQEAVRRSQTLATKEERFSEERRSSVWRSPRVRKREIYREIRSQIWGTLGKRQLHGWSLPLANTQEPVPEPKDVPVLMQLRLLDHKESTAKCSVWVVSGPASCSDITVIDPARSNTVLDQFSLPPTAPALCICAVPPINTAGTVWIGTQEGILVHLASAGRSLCLRSVSLSESVHSLYSQGQVIAGLGDGTLAFFSHSTGWNLQSHSLMPLGSNPVQPIRCCLAKGGRLWVGYWNKIYVVDTESKKVEQTFSVSERSEQQVRFLCAGGSGVWTSCRLDPILRLFDWSTGRPLQEVDFAALVTKTLQPFLTLSPLQISSLTVICGRLWVGTGGGAIFSIPLSISEDVSIPYCSTASAQLCYHGHRQVVRFIIAAPCLITNPGSSHVTTAQLILSGGEGYINFRIDDASDDSEEVSQATPQRSERSHMIIWQTPTPPVPNPAL